VLRPHQEARRDVLGGEKSARRRPVMSEHQEYTPGSAGWHKQQALRLATMNGQAVKPKRKLPPPGHPMRRDGELMAEQFSHPDHALLVQQGGQFYHWDGTCWPALDDKDVRTRAYTFTEGATYLHSTPAGMIEKGWHPTQRQIADFTHALRALAHIPANTPAPSWFADFPYAASEMVSCSNGLVHIPTRTLLSHSPLFYAHHAVPFAFNPNAPKPLHWLKFLRDVWGDDQESIDALQEIFGYV